MAWTDTARVARYLGPSVPETDPYLADCVDAANAWAQRKRIQAGYVVDTDISPSADVTQGTTMYAGELYRERGSADSFASFEETAGFAPIGTMGQINRLLGVGRAAVDAVPPEVVPLSRRRVRS
jgi:hypothetical protein